MPPTEGYSAYQVEMLETLGTIGACVQFALVLIGCLAAVLAVKALW